MSENKKNTALKIVASVVLAAVIFFISAVLLPTPEPKEVKAHDTIEKTVSTERTTTNPFTWVAVVVGSTIALVFLSINSEENKE